MCLKTVQTWVIRFSPFMVPRNVNTKDDVKIFTALDNIGWTAFFVVCGIIYIIRAIKDKD